jgi:hypothetical protein
MGRSPTAYVMRARKIANGLRSLGRRDHDRACYLHDDFGWASTEYNEIKQIQTQYVLL